MEIVEQWSIGPRRSTFFFFLNMQFLGNKCISISAQYGQNNIGNFFSNWQYTPCRYISFIMRITKWRIELPRVNRRSGPNKKNHKNLNVLIIHSANSVRSTHDAGCFSLSYLSISTTSAIAVSPFLHLHLRLPRHLRLPHHLHSIFQPIAAKLIRIGEAHKQCSAQSQFLKKSPMNQLCFPERKRKYSF